MLAFCRLLILTSKLFKKLKIEEKKYLPSRGLNPQPSDQGSGALTIRLQSTHVRTPFTKVPVQYILK